MIYYFNIQKPVIDSEKLEIRDHKPEIDKEEIRRLNNVNEMTRYK